jgi:hypothetical protein
MREKLSLKAVWEISRIDRKTGKCLSKLIKKNLIVNSGLEIVAKLLNGVSSKYFTRIGIGTDSTTPGEGETTLRSLYDIQVGEAEYENFYKSSLSYTFTFGSSVVIKEAGEFNDDTVMLNRVVFDDQNCGADVDLHVKVTVTVDRA